MLLITAAALVLGAAMGFCLHRFCQNGLIAKKHLDGPHDETLSHSKSCPRAKTSAPETLRRAALA